MFLEKLPKYLLWFTFILIIISFATLFIPSKFFCKAPEWFGILEDFHVLGQWILLMIVLPLAILLLILSTFLRFKTKGLLAITIILTVGGILLLWVGKVGHCPDKDRKAILTEFRAEELMFFEEHQQYAGYEELSYGNRYKDPETGELFILILTENKQNFEIRAKLDRGGWFVCSKEECEQRKEVNDEILIDEVSLPTVEKIYKDKESGAVYVRDEVVVRFKEGVSEAKIKEIISSVGGEIVGHIADIEIYQVLVPVTDPSELELIIQQLETYPEVIIATHHWLDEAF